ncbi:site-specific integrase [Aeromonas caviae]|uniref:tyrosine-type recombinase/integrase n=1 Tax=Aeromonas caviae TaxID=648 RepID=UPI0029DBAD99|nr:site-specific integrase [Aeromonas caviae]MDX7839467.1 site-specific integrase [Aeromonas caviae]
MKEQLSTSTADEQKTKSRRVDGTLRKRKQTQVTDKKIPQLKIISYETGNSYGRLCFSHLCERYSIGLGCVAEVGLTAIRDNARRLLADCYSNPEGFRLRHRALLPLATYVHERYLPDVHVTHRYPRTIESRVKPILAALGHKPLNQITRADFEDFLTQLSDTCSGATWNRYLAQCKSIMTHAVEHGVLPSSPAASIPAKYEPVLPPKGLPDEAVNKLVARLMEDKDEEKARMLLFLFATGSRMGEARALKLQDCNLTTQIAFLPTSKSGRERLIPLNQFALELVQLQRQRHGTTGLLFRGQDGVSPISEPRRYWYRVCNDCGLSGVRIHDSRHSVATSLLNKGCSLDVLQKVLGHSSPRMTERYARHHDKTLVKAVDVLHTVWDLPNLTC